MTERCSRVTGTICLMACGRQKTGLKEPLEPRLREDARGRPLADPNGTWLTATEKRSPQTYSCKELNSKHARTQILSLGLPTKERGLVTPRFQPSETHVALLTYKPDDDKRVVFETTKFVII